MPIRKVQASMHAREGSPQRTSHSPSRSLGMGNRQMSSLSSDGRPRQLPTNRLTKRTGMGLSRLVGEGSLHRKSSGRMTTVGDMIPFQKASRREPHITPLGQDRDGILRGRKTMQKKSIVDHSPNPEGGQPVHESRHNDDEPSRAVATSSSGVHHSLPHRNQKSGAPDGKHSHARSVRPKVKRPSLSKEQGKTSSSKQPSSHIGTAGASSGANHGRKDEEEAEIVFNSRGSTSPRRRIVKRKSQTQAAASNRELQIGTGSHEQNIALSESNRTLSRAEMPASVSSTQGSTQEMTYSSAMRQTSDDSRSSQILQPNLPEPGSRHESNFQDNNYEHHTYGDLPRNAQGSNNPISLETQPRPPLSAREALSRSLLRSRNVQSRSSSERPTIQPAIASATELDRSSNASPVRHETYPNSVRRSHERLQQDSQGNDIGHVERPRLSRQNVSGMTQRARQREMIDVNTAVSVLSRRMPISSTQSAEEGLDLHETPPSRQNNDARLREQDVWVPLRRTQHNSRQETQNMSRNSPRTPISSISPGESRLNTPDVLFRDSPVANLPHQRNSRLLSEMDDPPTVTYAARPAVTMPTRRGLYRALSVTESNDTIIQTGRNRLPRGNQRDTPLSRYDNLDASDIDSWTRIESDHSHPAAESRQRHIYLDRERGRESMLRRTTSGSRIVPPSIDSAPDINDNNEFPPLEPRQQSLSNRPSGQVGDTRQEQTPSVDRDHAQEIRVRNRRTETPPPTPTQGRNLTEQRSSDDEPDHMMEHLVLLASPIFGPLMLQASPAILFNMLSRARRDFGGEFVELLIENVVLSLLAQHTFDVTQTTQNNGGAPPPATQETIKALAKVTVTEKMVAEDAFCAICHCEYSVDEILDQLPCKHSFHNKCITIWLEKSGTCPVCRHKLYMESVD